MEREQHDPSDGPARGGWRLPHPAESIAHVVLAGILVDSVCQWLILGASYPGAALVVGPVLIALPYAAARALANRVTTA